MSEWISVDDELPKYGVDVLIFSKRYKNIRVAWLDDEGGWLVAGDHISSDGITHWMPLPDAPK